MSKEEEKLGGRQARTGAFLPHPQKAAAISDLMRGDSIEDVSLRYKMNERTVWRYKKDLEASGALTDRVNRQKDTPPDNTSDIKLDREKTPPKDTGELWPEDKTTSEEDTENNTKDDETMAETGKNTEDKPLEPTDGSEPGGVPPFRPLTTTALMIFREGGINVNMVIPPFVFTMFDMAKQIKLIPEDADFDLWVVECVVKRFDLDYKLQLGLTPILEEELDDSTQK